MFFARKDAKPQRILKLCDFASLRDFMWYCEICLDPKQCDITF